ncbi:eukaryotic translation initiation factor 4 gamma 2 isoform X1 [Microplitis demolitor]|uniref:eukaryotic translation initiation factor 4 gamma 2 isoform X1 n=2 Tax=Microplitis demolitor TaxID=69319 RepID=UPI0004CCE2A1|nr:eukaryotic translation initiation factor 4 gamma 2 isoform X1 [Microplitis demolitor]
MPSRDDNRSLSTERRWIPPSTVRRDAFTPENRNDFIFRKVRGILNKLTPEKFGKLSSDLLKIELNSDVILKGVIILIFDKALDEPKYSSMYAQLCKRLSDEAPNFESPKPTVDGQKAQSTFRILLLNKCKAEFENRSKANEAFENQDDLIPEEEERRQMAKRKMLGNIKFIGELGKLEIVSESILHRCIQQLLVEKRRRGPRGDAAEDIECLCQIMRTCGRILDSDKGQCLMEQYFKRMMSLAENSDLPLRIRFMLRDVIELRRDGWVPRKATSTEGPMPINQIRSNDDDLLTSQQASLQRNLQSQYNNHHHHRNNRDDSRIGNDFLRKIARPGMVDMDIVGSIPLTQSFGISNSFAGPNGFSGVPQPGAPGQGGANVGYGRRPPGNYFPNQRQTYPNKQQHAAANSFNNNANKEQSLRFNKNKMLIGHPEEVSLRPSTTSMLFKQTTIKPLPITNDLFPARTEAPLLRATTLKTPPLMHKDAAPIVIKQGPLDKREKARDRKDKGPTKEEIVKKVNAMMDDLKNVDDVNLGDAMAQFKDLKIPERFIRNAIATIYGNTLERGDSEREFAVKFVAELRKEGVVQAGHTMDGWKELVAGIADKESTVPCVASHVASITGKAIVNNLMMLHDLAVVTENGAHHPLFLLTLQQLHKTQGKAVLTQIFNDSKVNLMSQLPEAEKTKERLGTILEDRELTFLYPLLRIQGDMSRQLESDPSPNAFYKWIKDKLHPAHHADPGFINALMTVLLQYITRETTLAPGIDTTVVPDKTLQEKERGLLQKYTRVLESFLVTIDAQVTAVHSLQVFCLSHNFPKGMLLRWFVALYELSIIDEEAFIKWKEDVTDAYPGKGRALFQVNSWLTWLEQATSEEEEDEGDN